MPTVYNALQQEIYLNVVLAIEKTFEANNIEFDRTAFMRQTSVDLDQLTTEAIALGTTILD